MRAVLTLFSLISTISFVQDSMAIERPPCSELVELSDPDRLLTAIEEFQDTFDPKMELLASIEDSWPTEHAATLIPWIRITVRSASNLEKFPDSFQGYRIEKTVGTVGSISESR